MNSDRKRPNGGSKALLIFTIAAAIACLVVSYHNVDLRTQNFNIEAITPSSNSLKVEKEVQVTQLEYILRKAAMADNVVIICTLNAAWTEPGSIFDLFLESFKIGIETVDLLKHLLVVSFDQKAFDHCMSLNLHCYWVIMEGIDDDISKDAFFGSPNYVEMIWKRIDFLRIVLEMGYSFVFTDADVMWLRNPFPRFYEDTDIQVACDIFFGNPTDLKNMQNMGFTHVRSNNRTVELYKLWYKSRNHSDPNRHDQHIFNDIKYDRFVVDTGLTIKFLDTTYFGGLCQPSGDMNLVCTMHANCCVGLDNKIHDLKLLLEDWRKYLSLSGNVTDQLPSWTVPQHC